MVSFVCEVIKFAPTVKVPTYQAISEKLEKLEEGQCVQIKVDSRYMTNRICAGVRMTVRKKFKLVTQREGGYLYLYRGPAVTSEARQ